ncbi:MAG: glucose-6-phosphate isomerase family protein [Patescibacteria group bacterium]|nr:glucose-6-phosphate isomerase family protein [Patescibacteria group bacterium]
MKLHNSGLPISFLNGKLISTKEIDFQPVQARKFKEIKGYLQNKNSSSKLRNVYLMFRDVHFKKDGQKFRKNNLRYDITVIFPALFGKEFSKTIGHNHKPFRLKSFQAPEIYEVLSGEALFLFQNIKKKEAYLIKAQKGEKVIVPFDCGHVTINLTNKILIVSNIFASNIKSDYNFFKKHRGAAFYILKEKTGIFIEKNPLYKEKINLKIRNPKKEALELPSKKSLYELFVKTPEKFAFLTQPEKFKKQLSPKNLFSAS